MNNENFHPTGAVPPLAHALHHWDEASATLRYEYNGVDIITISLPQGKSVGFRHGSDGSMQSGAYCQQIYISADEPITAVMTLTLTDGAMNLRPHRAGSEQAILGQLGAPLIRGVNGMYDANWDLLLDWHGCDWHWLDQSLQTAGNRRVARLAISFSKKAMFLNLRPQYYRRHLGYSYHEPWNARPNPKPVAGWCSWEAYRRNVDIDKIAEISAFMDEKLKGYGLEYIQLDDGYQKMPLPADPAKTMAEGWLTCEETRFPDGHESVVDTIAAHGFSPAVWTNANITNPAFPSHHPEDVIFHEGRPLKGEWIDFLYSCTPDCLATQVTPLFARLRELGYRYIKIDAIRHLLFDGLHECVRLGMMTNEEAERRFRAYMQATRAGMGRDVYYLASWGEMDEIVGVADACRISMDANPTWAGVRMQLFESARWFHTQRILFLNDPDHVCARTKTLWAQSVLSLISLSGELYMLSDTPDAYTEEKLAVIRKTLPPLATKTAETGPLSLDYPAYTWTKLHGFAVQSHETPVEMEDVSIEDALAMAGDFPTMENDHPFSCLWAFHLQGAQGDWCVAQRVATVPLRAAKLPLERLGLDPAQSYYAFDFWSQSYFGTVTGELICEALPIGGCQVIALHAAQDRPLLIASSRHVSMDAVSVKRQEADRTSLALTLQCPAGTSENYYVHLPQGLRAALVTATGGSAVWHQEGELLTLAISFETDEVELRLVAEEDAV